MGIIGDFFNSHKRSRDDVEFTNEIVDRSNFVKRAYEKIYGRNHRGNKENNTPQK